MKETNSAKPIIQSIGLTKRYPNGTLAVDNLNLTIREGEVYGMLGPNGSGKTTTILMLIGLTEATGGEVSVVGHNPLREPLAVKRFVAYMPDSVGFYSELSAIENLEYTSALAQIPAGEMTTRIEQSLDRMGLADVGNAAVGTFSRGMRQRLALAEVLVKKPQVAILDEPTQGLDPESAHEFLQLIGSLRSDGITVLLSSHLLDQVQQICDRVGLFYKGSLILEGTVEELSDRVMGDQFGVEMSVKTKDRLAFYDRLLHMNEVKQVEIRRHRLDEVYRTQLAKERQNADK